MDHSAEDYSATAPRYREGARRNHLWRRRRRGRHRPCALYQYRTWESNLTTAYC